MIHSLPLRLLSALESLQNVHLGLKGLQPRPQVRRNLRLIISKLSIEVLAVWACGHGGREDRLDQEAVVWLESGAIGIAEGDGELVGGVLEVGGDCEAGEFKSASQPLAWDLARGR